MIKLSREVAKYKERVIDKIRQLSPYTEEDMLESIDGGESKVNQIMGEKYSHGAHVETSAQYFVQRLDRSSVISKKYIGHYEEKNMSKALKYYMGLSYTKNRRIP